MNRELAIRILVGDVIGTTEQTHEAAKMAVEALQQKTGKWIREGEDGYCSICNCDMPIFMEDWEYKSCETEFCPNCGTRMECEDNV